MWMFFVINLLVFYWRLYEVQCHEIKITSMNADMNENLAQKLWNVHWNQWTHSVSTTAEQEVHHEFHEEEPPISVYFWHVCCAGTGTNGSYGRDCFATAGSPQVEHMYEHVNYHSWPFETLKKCRWTQTNVLAVPNCCEGPYFIGRSVKYLFLWQSSVIKTMKKTLLLWENWCGFIVLGVALLMEIQVAVNHWTPFRSHRELHRFNFSFTLSGKVAHQCSQQQNASEAWLWSFHLQLLASPIFRGKHVLQRDTLVWKASTLANV